MLARSEIREEDTGWTVFDVFTGQPVVIDDIVQANLGIQEADDLVDLLNVAAEGGLRNVLQQACPSAPERHWRWFAAWAVVSTHACLRHRS